MDEKKLENLDIENSEIVEEEAVEEVTEEVIEDVIEEAEETSEEVIEIVDDQVAGEVIAESFDKEDVERIKAGMGAGNIAAIIAGGVVLLSVIVYLLVWVTGWLNPYNLKYANTTGLTIKEAAENSGYTLSEYKKSMDLPFFMPASTNENAANNSTKLSTIIERTGLPFEEYKAYYGWGDDVTEKMTVGEALGRTKISVILNDGSDATSPEEELSKFKEYYGYGDEITGDTLYQDVRKKIDKKAVEERKAREKEAKEQENTASVEAE